MKYVEAVETYDHSTDPGLSIFLAGAITGAPDWQSEVVAKLSNEIGLTLLNPRRKHFPIEDPKAAEAQIKWEFEHLRKADAILFWFPKEALAPIALFELGVWLMSGKPLFIGVEPGYVRGLDVHVQVRLAKAGRLKVFESLDELVVQAREFGLD